MSAISLNMRKHYGPLLNGFYHIPFLINRGCMSKMQIQLKVSCTIKRNVCEICATEEVACIVVETIQGDGGLLEPVDVVTLRALEALCREHGTF